MTGQGNVGSIGMFCNAIMSFYHSRMKSVYISIYAYTELSQVKEPEIEPSAYWSTMS